jgi:hypothetical protein
MDNPEEKIDKLMDKLPSIIQESTEESSESIFNSMISNLDNLYSENKKEQREYCELIESKWYQAMSLLQGIIVISTEISTDLLDRFNEDEFDPKELEIYSVLLKLQSRAVLISKEIFSLVENGYPDGALARWRSLHENVVIFSLLKENIKDTNFTLDLIGRFMDYSLIEEWKFARKLSAEKVEKGYFKDLTDTREKILKKYGDSFKEANMWALPLFPTKKKIFFSDLEAKAKLNNLNIYYSQANTQVHTSPMGMYESLSLQDKVDQKSFYLFGSSFYGNALPIQLTGISLAQISTALLSINPNIDDIITMRVIMKFNDLCNESSDQIRSEIKPL